ncbi:MAG: ABC transporter permease [Candidatus Puniceispirillaceae bacterium]|jgi:simple sugar transport system permease protein
MKNSATTRQESDRLEAKSWLNAVLARPEIGPIGVMLLLFGMLGYFSIPAGEFSLNPFAGEGFNALGVRNNLRVISQLGIIALGAGLLIIAGEFDLSIGSMIGFAGACMAMILRWGFAIVIPYLSFDGGMHIEFFTLIHITDVSPLTAIGITMCFTLFFGWLQGYIVVKSGLPSFIVTLGGLFFLRGLTEVSLRAFNHRPDQTKGATTVTEIPDIKNIIEVPGYGEMEREAAKALPEADLQAIVSSLPADTIAAITERLEYTYNRVAEAKTDILLAKGVKPLERALENALASGNDYMANTIQDKIANFKIDPVVAKTVTDADIARAYLDSIVTARPVANFFGGDILEPVFDWLYFPIDWNTNNFGNQFAPGLYSCVMIWVLLSILCYIVLSKTQAGNWIYSTGGNLNAAKANGVPTNKVKISLFVFSAFCATIFATCQVFEVNTADAAKGNLKELEAIAAAVIGGIVMTGGFGTIMGIIVGAFIFGIAKEAFFYIPGIDGSFYRVFLGLVIVASALLNENIRKRIMGTL